MKKILSFALSILLILNLFVIPVSAARIPVLLDGAPLYFDVPPQIINGRTMVPMRTIFEALGASVEWDGNMQKITAKKQKTTVVMQIGSYTFTVNGNVFSLDTAPQIINQRTLVPIRAVAESFDITVEWNADTNTVFMSTTNAFAAAKNYQVFFDGNLCKVRTAYNAYEDIVWEFHKPTDHGNGLPDFKTVYITNKSTYELRTLFYNTSDMFGPMEVSALSNIDGDNPTSSQFTGGNHRSTDLGVGGTPTAECISWNVYANYKPISSQEVYANNVSMEWVNLIKGGNLIKADGSGRYVIQENIRLSFVGTKINVEITHTALEDVKRTVYYGLQGVQGNFVNIRYDGSTVNQSPFPLTVDSNSGDKICRSMTVSTATNDMMRIGIHNVGLGDFSQNVMGYSFFASAESGPKFYSAPILNYPANAPIQHAGEKTVLSGYYEFFKQ